MSPTNPGVDLSSLARPSAPAASKPPRRHWLFVALPVALLAGFLAVLATSLGDWLGGALEVELVRPVPVAGGGQGRPAGAVAVQAAGWVEPDPFPIEVTALAPGVVREILVRESDAVEAGAPVAQLVDEDARLACRQAEAELAEATAELALREAELKAAQETFDAALALRERAAVAEADLDGKRAAAEAREQAAVEGRARSSAAESELEVQRFLAAGGAAGPRAVELAEAALAEVKAAALSLAADAALAGAETRGAEAVLLFAQRDLELRIEDKLRVATAEAGVALARAQRGAAEARHDEAQLRLERTTVRAPQAGVVLQRFVGPGAALTEEKAAVAALYDPGSLRVRVDVPQADIAKLFVGQEVRIEVEARQGQPYAGQVLRILRQADINKVTLQAHVRIAEPDVLLRPEMLVQARFLAGGAAEGEQPAAPTGGGAVRIPARLVVEGSRVWVLDALGKRAELRAVQLGAEEGGEVEVLQGLNLSDKLIATRLDELSPGRAVKVKAGER